ncbi:MAG: thermonuclease family protein [Alphaproteobacteria bacterium]|nr:thermonuclease family protein [Alphaproteobacteria bacterium]
MRACTRRAIINLPLLVIPISALAADDFPPAPSASTVVSVYDGDTFTLATGDKVRVSGVNTPELRPSEPFGIEAREATADFVLNQEVELIYGSVERDSYGRLLAYVRVDGEPLEEHLIELGLGHTFLIPPVEVADVDAMLAAQVRAREAGLGIWSTESYRSTLHMTSFHANAPGEDTQNVNGEYLRVCNITAEPVNLAGYTVTNVAGETFTLPDMEIPAGHTFKLVSGKGAHQTDPAHQLEVYLGSERPVWNNGFDRATILDPDGEVVDTREHKVKKPTR